jgi:ribosome-binding factor A
MSVPGRRQQRLEALIQTTLSELLQEMKDPRLEMVSITRVDLAKDMKTARVAFSVLGDESRQNGALEGLQHARGRFQAGLHDQLKLRYTPVLSFEYDPAIAGSLRISELLREALGASPASQTSESSGNGDEEASDDDQ